MKNFAPPESLASKASPSASTPFKCLTSAMSFSLRTSRHAVTNLQRTSKHAVHIMTEATSRRGQGQQPKAVHAKTQHLPYRQQICDSFNKTPAIDTALRIMHINPALTSSDALSPRTLCYIQYVNPASIAYASKTAFLLLYNKPCAKRKRYTTCTENKATRTQRASRRIQHRTSAAQLVKIDGHTGPECVTH